MGDVWNFACSSIADLFQIAANCHGFMEYRVVFSRLFDSVYGGGFVMASPRTVSSISDVAPMGWVGAAGRNAVGVVSCRVFCPRIHYADVIRSRGGVLLFDSRRLAAVPMGGACVLHIIFHVPIILGN